MDSREIRSKFLTYFKSHGHEILESASLVPQDDPTLLFINSGMAPLKRLFLGEENRGYTRAADSQKCVRAGGKHNDLDNVGFTPRHHTFFEMLGNFSFGDYFKNEAIDWAWDLLTEGYGLPADQLYVSVYKDDDEAFKIWEHQIGIPSNRIIRLGEKDNFWTMGDTGPCGPCSEIHIDQGPSMGCGKPDCAPGCDCDRYLEIWNLVFTQFDRSADGELTPLPKPNIDTGMGLERLAAVVQKVTSNYDTDLFKTIIKKIEEISEKQYGDDERQDISFRVIADHSRAATFLIGDGIMPSNEGRGYVLRRIIRRAIRFGQILGLNDLFLKAVCMQVIDTMGVDYKALIQSKSFIEGIVKNEEKRFADTLHYSMKVLNEEIEKLKDTGGHTIPGEVAFKLYDTYGLSVDIVEDAARDEGLSVDMGAYRKAMTRQRTMSQESWKGSGEEEIPKAYRTLQARGLTSRFVGYESLSAEAKVVAIFVEGKEVSSIAAGNPAEIMLDQTTFYGKAGGQVGDTGLIRTDTAKFFVTETCKYGVDLIIHVGRLEKGDISEGERVRAFVDEEKRKSTMANHSATHLLHAALRETLGDHVKQAGSLVAPDRFRFDFSHFTQVTPDALKEVERAVNRHIRNNLTLDTKEMTKEEALKTGAMAIFEERYGENVRLVSIGDGVSMELCGGTHTHRTGDIGLFRIISESAVAANVRRIEALSGDQALDYDQKLETDIKLIASHLKTSPDKVVERLERLISQSKKNERELETLKNKLISKKSDDLLSGISESRGIRYIAREIEAGSPKELREAADRIKVKLGTGIILLAARNEGKVLLTCVVTSDLTDRFKASDIIKPVSQMVKGKGGGRPDMAQGGGTQPDKLKDALNILAEFIEKKAKN